MILNVVGAAVLASSALGWLPNAAVPDPVSQWATESGPAAVRTVIAGDPEWLKDVLGEGSDLTLGRPVPVSTLAAEDLPHFDLRSGAMAAIPDSASIVRPATEWASRVQVDGVGRDAVAWIELTAAGVVTLQGVDEVRWLPAVRDLPQDGVVPVNGGVFAFSAGVFTALDAHAAFDAPTARFPLMRCSVRSLGEMPSPPP